HPRGYLGATTEAMPILASHPYALLGETMTTSGGVSLGRTAEFQSRPPIARELPPAARRSEINYGSLKPGGEWFVGYQGTRFAFERDGPDRARVLAVPERNTRLRDRSGELFPIEGQSRRSPLPAIEGSVTTRDGAVEFRAQVGQADLASVQVRRQAAGLT